MKKHEKIIKALEAAVEDTEILTSMWRETHTDKMKAYWTARKHEAVFALSVAKKALND